ncbi:MAG: AbrB/MazE/SpoVT family DNA-binding domain-containing protein [Egibacteraceae bacterium]
MKTTIDSAGRVVIPKAMRQRLGLSGRGEIEIVERQDGLELRAATAAVWLIEDDQGVRAEPEQPLPPLTDELVRGTLEQTRR